MLFVALWALFLSPIQSAAMGNYTLSQISRIIEKRPNGPRIKAAQKWNKKLMLHLHGVGMKNALAQLQYFENNDIYKARRDYAISNVDLFSRLLKEEDQVFTTRGGSSYFNLPDSEEKQMHELLSNVIYGQSLRQWVRNFGLNAYRADPMGVIFMEVEKVTAVEGVDNVGAGKSLQYDINTPKCYPTYKCIQDIWEYQPNGRRLDYLCLALTEAELVEYGVKEQSTTVYPQPVNNNVSANKQYFRWIDDDQDILLKLETNATMGADGKETKVTPLVIEGQQNPIKGLWNRVPGFIVSDLIQFTDPATFNTPVAPVVELADAFLYDRSINTLTKKYHGFPKAVEPLLMCATCGGNGFTTTNKGGQGEGMTKGTACPDCTIPGQTKGTGYKLQTKVSDVAKFPLSILGKDASPQFDFKKIFGYVTPDIEGLKMQAENLKGLEELMQITYWSQNNNQIQGYNGKQDTQETATKTLTDLQGKYARLNSTADWAEGTERMIANFIGQFWFSIDNFNSNISYGRNYILETPDTILETYYEMKANGVPDSMLDNQYEKYINALWQSNPIQAQVYHKKFDVEPFPHISADDVDLSEYILEEDKICKRYFGEWDDTVKDGEWLVKPVEVLRGMLLKYATAKQLKLDAQAEKKAAQEIKKQQALTAVMPKIKTKPKLAA